MQNTSTTSPSDAPGDISATSCAGCGAPLPPDWVYACEKCCTGWLENENNRMHGESDD
ncbi:MAG TPA: protein ninF [Pantoea sp.]|nr:protein ninF [Pantoea sp.]